MSEANSHIESDSTGRPVEKVTFQDKSIPLGKDIGSVSGDDLRSDRNAEHIVNPPSIEGKGIIDRLARTIQRITNTKSSGK